MVSGQSCALVVHSDGRLSACGSHASRLAVAAAAASAASASSHADGLSSSPSSSSMDPRPVPGPLGRSWSGATPSAASISSLSVSKRGHDGHVLALSVSKRGHDGHVLAATVDGELYAWGDGETNVAFAFTANCFWVRGGFHFAPFRVAGDYGKLGLGNTTSQKTPKRVLLGGLASKVVVHVSAGTRCDSYIQYIDYLWISLLMNMILEKYVASLRIHAPILVQLLTHPFFSIGIRQR